MSDTVGRHHRRSIRLPGYDYSQPGMYFVTICVEGKACLFGEVVKGEMVTNKIGKIVEDEWLKTAVLRPSVKLDEYVVMPNHFHGIVEISHECRGTARRAPTTNSPSREGETSRAPASEFGKPAPGSLPTIVRAFKSAVTQCVHDLRGASGASLWQRNYYEHVIRNEDDLRRIREYIQTNPVRWELDRENPAKRGEDEFDRWWDSLSRKKGQGKK
ncbi:MAG: transposase [Candidatus Binatia bacterium]